MFVSCSKHDHDCNHDNKDMAGSWKWLSTDGGIANNIHETPASTGKNINLVLSADNTYSVMTNGSVTSQGTYALDMRTCIHDHSNKRVINFSGAEDIDVMVESLANGMLTVSDENYDGTISRYIKN